MDPISLAALGIGGLSSLMGSRSATRAAEIQAQAAREAAQTQLQAGRESNELVRQMYLSNLGLQAPGIRTGQLALSALSSGLGLGPVQAAPRLQSTVQGQPTYTNAQGQTVDAQGRPVTQMPGIPDVSQYGATQAELEAAGQPFAGRLTETFKPSDLTLDPSYQFRLNQGLRALQARGAATGMLQTGQGLRDISDYAQQSASQEYGSAYDRFMRNQQALYERLSGLAGVGERAAGGATAAGARTAEAMGQTTTGAARAASDYLTSGAAARAAGQVGSTQALTGGLQGGIQDWMTLQYLNRMPEQAKRATMVPSATGSFPPPTIG